MNDSPDAHGPAVLRRALESAARDRMSSARYVDPDHAPLGLAIGNVVRPRQDATRGQTCIEHIALDHIADTLPMVALRRFFYEARRHLAESGELSLVFAHPDRRHDSEAASVQWPGDPLILPNGQCGITRPLRHYIELARLFGYRPRVPEPLPTTVDWLVWRFDRLRTVVDFYEANTPNDASGRDQKYGAASRYRRFRRLEEPEILDDLMYGLSRLRPRPGERVLALGVNDARELDLFGAIGVPDVECHGIDLSTSAIAAARERYPQHHFYAADFANLSSLELEDIDLILALNVFQLSGIDRDGLLARMDTLRKRTARWLISIPNCHFGPNDILRRPIDRKHPRHDRSLVHKDLRYLTRYFYRAGYRHLECYGTYDAFLVVSG